MFHCVKLVLIVFLYSSWLSNFAYLTDHLIEWLIDDWFQHWQTQGRIAGANVALNKDHVPGVAQRDCAVDVDGKAMAVVEIWVAMICMPVRRKRLQVWTFRKWRGFLALNFYQLLTLVSWCMTKFMKKEQGVKEFIDFLHAYESIGSIKRNCWPLPQGAMYK